MICPTYTLRPKSVKDVEICWEVKLREEITLSYQKANFAVACFCKSDFLEQKSKQCETH